MDGRNIRGIVAGSSSGEFQSQGMKFLGFADDSVVVISEFLRGERTVQNPRGLQ